MVEEGGSSRQKPEVGAEFFSRVQLFNGMPAEALTQLGSYVKMLEPRPGDSVFTQGEIGDSLFIVASGSVNILVRNIEGRTIRTATLRKGEYFGELSAMDGKPRTGTAVVAESTLLLEVSRARFEELINRQPVVIKNLLLQFCGRVREFEVKMMNFEWEAHEDKLTGLPNRRWFDTVLENEFQRSMRYKHPLSLLMVDIDHFKNVNDVYGHVAGDRVLQEVSAVIKAGTRTSDSAARYGGEEFAVILPDTEIKDATLVADRVRQHVEEYSFLDEQGKRIDGVTISIGAGTSVGLQRPAELVEHVDQALYVAKGSGRNCVKSIND